MGSLTKQFYRYTHKRNMRHNENLWPYVKIARNESGEISDFVYRGQPVLLTSLTSLKNAFSGEVLITATGPSVKKIDFSTLPVDVIRTGVNGAWHLHNQLSFSHYFIVDMTFIDRQTALLKRIVANKNLLLFTTAMGVVKLIDRFSYENIHCQIAIIEDICYETYKPSIKREALFDTLKDRPGIVFSENTPNSAFSLDICQGIVDAGTVVYWALQVLYYMGFSKIYIAGLDMTHFSQPRFYEKAETMLPSFLEDKVQDIVLPALSLASKIFASANKEVINLSPQSAIPSSVFVRKDFTDVFK
ncbi:TPA: sugar glycosyltransferase [Enterobacter ludwigii]|nr:sugar glycosyltransferase [Enterobacter ludwigii]